MNIQHKTLAAGRWKELPFVEQMAHIGGEVERALKWREADNEDYSRLAFYRALELIDLSRRPGVPFPRLKELGRLREALVDYFFGDNAFQSTAESWRKYFLAFTYAARRAR